MAPTKRATYSKPRVERFGSLRELTQVGCTLGGDGIWICSPPPPNITPPGNGDDEDNGDRS